MEETTNTVQSFGDVVNSLDFSVITDNAFTVIGAVAGIVVAMIALKKGWSFLKGQIKGA